MQKLRALLPRFFDVLREPWLAYACCGVIFPASLGLHSASTPTLFALYLCLSLLGGYYGGLRRGLRVTGTALLLQALYLLSRTDPAAPAGLDLAFCLLSFALVGGLVSYLADQCRQGLTAARDLQAARMAMGDLDALRRHHAEQVAALEGSVQSLRGQLESEAHAHAEARTAAQQVEERLRGEAQRRAEEQAQRQAEWQRAEEKLRREAAAGQDEARRARAELAEVQRQLEARGRDHGKALATLEEAAKNARAAEQRAQQQLKEVQAAREREAAEQRKALEELRRGRETERRQRDEQRQALARAEFLADTGRALAGCLERDSIVRIFLRQVIPYLGSGCVLRIADAAGATRPLAAAIATAGEVKQWLAGEEEDAELAPLLEEESTPEPALHIPLPELGEWRGVVSFFHEAGEPPDEDAAEAAVAALAAALGAATEHREACTARAELRRRYEEAQALLEETTRPARAPQPTVSSEVRLERQPVELAELVQRVVAAVEPVVEAQRQHLTVYLPLQPEWLLADAGLLAQALAVLLESAARHNAPGSEVRLSVERQGDELTLAVRDLPKERELDLDAVRDAADRHGGRVDTTPGSVVLHLPAPPAGAEQALSAA